MKKFLIVIIIAVSVALNTLIEKNPNFLHSSTGLSKNSDTVLQTAYKNRENNLQVKGTGVVYRTLPDDLYGSRHQNFLIHTSTGQTILVAHNIDLSRKINSLRPGDTIEFYGEYEWSQKGGVIHWTHQDPGGRHIGGWLKHQGITYQ